MFALMGLVVDAEFDYAYRIRKWAKGTTRPLMIKFLHLSDVSEFLRARKNLVGTSIWIDHARSLVSAVSSPTNKKGR